MSRTHGFPVQPLIMPRAHGGLPVQPHVMPHTHPFQPLVRSHTHGLDIQPLVTRRHVRTRKPLIQRLPVEIRCRIFYYCSATECRYDPKGISDANYINEHGDTDRDEKELRKAYQRVPRWIAILLVCHDWYHIAVNFSDLWIRLDFSSLRLTRVFLERSKSRPLDVVAFLPPDPDLQTLQLIMAHFPRIRKLLLFAWKADHLISILTARGGARRTHWRSSRSIHIFSRMVNDLITIDI
ncbi:hypothetical protein EWM64_g4933 [Hericium alpestre]|uniref:Uncharacterized protein n=1 Tax=Hericium alpestre TaxID=135208 RepID=A0A4Y9ZYQ4_9AGAM|nr:hypothetical protein EWM64_g4933 [Hericium alpestre]